VEELLALVPAKDTTEAVDLYTALQSTFKTCQLKINNMCTLTTDGISALLGNKGVAAMLEKDAEVSRNSDTSMFHWIVQI
jgi:hypothetical protein